MNWNFLKWFWRLTLKEKLWNVPKTLWSCFSKFFNVLETASIYFRNTLKWTETLWNVSENLCNVEEIRFRFENTRKCFRSTLKCCKIVLNFFRNTLKWTKTLWNVAETLWKVGEMFWKNSETRQKLSKMS